MIFVPITVVGDELDIMRSPERIAGTGPCGSVRGAGGQLISFWYTAGMNAFGECERDLLQGARHGV